MSLTIDPDGKKTGAMTIEMTVVTTIEASGFCAHIGECKAGPQT
jgi:hypothetical protein